MGMSLTELDQYADRCGIDVNGMATKEEKVAVIEERRGRVAEVEALGTMLVVPVRKMHDKRVRDLFERGSLSDAEAEWMLAQVLGEEQYAKVIELCTDEDDVVDYEAVSHVFRVIINCEDLKNF